MMEIANSPVGPYVSSNTPNLSEQFIGNFKLPPGTTSITRKQLYQESVQTLNKVDPQWSSSQYKSTTIKSVEKITIEQTPWTGLLHTQCLQTVPTVSSTVNAPSDDALLLAGQQTKQAVAQSVSGNDAFATLRSQYGGYTALLR